MSFFFAEGIATLSTMAKKVITTTEFTDDIDGGKAEGTVSFAFQGTNYEIDLSRANTRALEKVLKPYTDAARKVRSSRGRSSTARKGGGKHDLSAVREWAQSNGYDVAPRGRIASTVVDAYNSAN
jgi:hypothetical protein